MKPLLVLDVNGILCHRIRGSNDVPLALQPLLKETIPVKLYRDPIGHPRLQYACSGTNGFNVISRVFLEGILFILYFPYYFMGKENSKEFDENALSRENPEGAVVCLGTR